MKYLKILGLAAVAAAAFMAFVGAGTASAETTLCTETATPCTHVPTGTTLEGEGVAGEGVTLPTLTAPFGNIRCNSTIKGKVETTTTPEGVVKAADLPWTNCVNGTAETVTPGKIRIHHDAEHNGIVTLEGFVVKVTQGVPCYYEAKTTAGGPLEGTLTGGTVGGTAIIHITAEPLKIDTPTHNSDPFCPAHAPWHATYKLTAPAGKSLFVGTT